MALDYCIGADLSFLKQQEDGGTRFRDSGAVKPGLQIFRDHGYGWIRLRLFYQPSLHPDRLPNDLAYTTDLAKQAKARGFRFLLDFHYSDSWADPGKQNPPAAWAGLNHAQLTDSVCRYTSGVIAALRSAQVLPDMVQIGNEITAGMLWPDGSSSSWSRLGDLIKAGIRGVDSGRGDAAMPLIMLHVDGGGNQAVTQWWFDNALAQGIAFDVIGQSYYPQWHGTLADLRDNFTFMGNTYGKDIILVETALNADSNGVSPFPLTNQGQADFLKAVNEIVRTAPHGRGKGVFWWEPTRSPDPPTRNFFDAGGNAKPVIRVYDGYVPTSIGNSRGGRKTPRRKPYAVFPAIGGSSIRPDGRLAPVK